MKTRNRSEKETER